MQNISGFCRNIGYYAGDLTLGCFPSGKEIFYRRGYGMKIMIWTSFEGYSREVKPHLKPKSTVFFSYSGSKSKQEDGKGDLQNS